MVVDGSGGASGVEPQSGASPLAAEVASALVNLGYQRPQAAGAVAAAIRELGEDAGMSALIRRALREMA
jgi:Holliday junction DNA helicase RuvA